MIFKGAVPPARQLSSQRNYNIFNLINGLSYMCLGETVIILLAVRLNCPDYIISSLGAMLYFGYLLLPLGKIVTARIGAAQSQATFWVLRNTAALLVALASPAGILGYQKIAIALLLVGAFLFYGFRAAGVVLSQPLIGDFTDDVNRAKVIAVSVGLFYISCLIALITITILLKFSQSLLMLTGIVVAGAALGFTSSRYIRRIDETENIQLSARKPILDQAVKIFKKRLIRRQLAAGFANNLAIIMLVPISMLALKRGYGVSDTAALIFAIGQFAACAGVSIFSGKIAEKIGPRKTMLLAYCLMLGIGVIWICAPSHLIGICMMPVFLLCGGAQVSLNNSMIHYFLQTVVPENRVAASIFIAVATGAGAGIIGMLAAGALLKWCAPETFAAPLDGYRLYFLLATLILLPGVWILARLTPLPKEKRKLKRTWAESR